MKAVVYQEPYQVAVENVDDPKIENSTDALIKVTSTYICGSDLHMYEGRTAAEAGIVFGHESMGIVEEIGNGVTKLKKGDRISLPFNVACGCKNCENGYTGFCLNVNEGFAGGAYGYVAMGPYRGGQAKYLRVPFADFTHCNSPKATSTRTTSRCSPTSSPPAITPPRWPTSARATPLSCSVPARSG